MSQPDLFRRQVVRLARQQPHLRPHLLPLLRQASVKMSDVEKINELTDNNWHTEAGAALAKVLGMKKEEKILKLIIQIQDIENHMPGHLNDYRTSIMGRVNKVAQNTKIDGSSETVYENLQ